MADCRRVAPDLAAGRPPANDDPAPGRHGRRSRRTSAADRFLIDQPHAGAVPHQRRRPVPRTAADPLGQHRDPHLRVPAEHRPGGLLPRPGHGLLGQPASVRAPRHAPSARRPGRAPGGPADAVSRSARSAPCSAASRDLRDLEPAPKAAAADSVLAPRPRCRPHVRPDDPAVGDLRPGRPAARPAAGRPPEHDRGVLGERRRQPGRHLAVRRWPAPCTCRRSRGSRSSPSVRSRSSGPAGGRSAATRRCWRRFSRLGVARRVRAGLPGRRAGRRTRSSASAT